MAERIYQDSTYKFTDPIRFFKANDPYYFEVDNIPIKQLQENCLWLKDQIRRDATIKISSVKRADIDELRPYATGADRTVRVKPGRYTARINDASRKAPLAYLQKVMGEALGDVDAYSAALPNAGTFPNNKNAILQSALDTFKSTQAQNAMGLNGLAERAFTWPVVNVDTPVDGNGAKTTGATILSYGGFDVNAPGGGASLVPFVITQALLWAKATNAVADQITLPTFETTNPDSGFAKLPKTENFLIKAWRGVSRLAVVDVEDEISIEVPQFDPADFSYTDEFGVETTVAGVQQRIDLVFIYSKPIDMSSVNIIDRTGRQSISKPQLGIVRGAGIKVNLNPTTLYRENYIVPANDSILAHPADQFNDKIGFTSTSSNDIAFDVRGSFPSPDDILNIAPLISEKLEDTAYELVGQSILPIAYVFVQDGSQVVLSTDVIDIRPFFRTAELSYNERTGIAAAFPQLSLANPAVGKAQLDHEVKNVYENLNEKIDVLRTSVGDPQTGMNTLATGYIFGGWNFGPEGALYDYYKKRFASDNVDVTLDTDTYVKTYIVGNYGLGGAAAQISVPVYPDWDLSKWCTIQDLSDKGLYVNDYINTFVSNGTPSDDAIDATVVGGSFRGAVRADGLTPQGQTPKRLTNTYSNTIFHYVSKKIKFVRPTWLADYKVNVGYLNCLPQTGTSRASFAWNPSYFGTWVEKGFDYFIIYVAWFSPEGGNAEGLPIPAPYTVTNTSGGKKKKTNISTVSNRGSGAFAGFIVPVGDILYTNTDALSVTNTYNVATGPSLGAGLNNNSQPVTQSVGYKGNPRIARCTYPTVMWSIEGIPVVDAPYLYGNLNGTNPTITLKEK